MQAAIVPVQDLHALTAILQTSLTPAFLLVALGALLNLFTGRLSRIVDRSRDLQDKHPHVLGVERARLVKELQLLEKRMQGVGRSIMLAVLAAVFVCIVIALLFVMGLGGFKLAWLAVACFGLGLGCRAAAVRARGPAGDTRYPCPRRIFEIARSRGLSLRQNEARNCSIIAWVAGSFGSFASTRLLSRCRR